MAGGWWAGAGDAGLARPPAATTGVPGGEEPGEGEDAAGPGTAANAAVAAEDAAAGAAGAGVAVAGAAEGAGVAGAPAVAAPAIGRSTLRLIGRPQLGQKRSSPLWIAAQRGHAVMPASRRTVTGWRSDRLASSARSSASMRVSVASLASTSESLRWPKRCRLNTSPPRSR